MRVYLYREIVGKPHTSPIPLAIGRSINHVAMKQQEALLDESGVKPYMAHELFSSCTISVKRHLNVSLALYAKSGAGEIKVWLSAPKSSERLSAITMVVDVDVSTVYRVFQLITHSVVSSRISARDYVVFSGLGRQSSASSGGTRVSCPIKYPCSVAFNIKRGHTRATRRAIAHRHTAEAH